MLDAIVNATSWFVNLFSVAGQSFWGMFSGVLPMLICMMTFMSTIISYIGEHRIEKIGHFLGKYKILSYTVLPCLISICIPGVGGLVLASKFVPEDSKLGFIDAKLTMVHPSLGLFPHVNGAEVWVFMGIAAGLTTQGLDTSSFAIRAFLSALVMMPIRAYSSQFVYSLISKRNKEKAVA